MRRALVLIAVSALFAAGESRACTTFCFEAGGTRVFGKNYDWNVDDGLVVVNKRGVAKTAFTEDNPAAWTSRFGSVTFNQYGREFPSGGINEKGLVVELMWLDETMYPEPDRRRALPTLQWIQYQLDNSATVDDVVASDAKVRIADGGSARIHFLVADATGAVATFESLNGRMAVHRGDDLPYPVLTNDMYQVSVTYTQNLDAQEPLTGSSLDRFARAARGLAPSTKKSNPVDEAFALLDQVAQGEYTQWSIVYDIGERRAHFRTRRQRDVRFVDLDALDFSCKTPVRVVDVNAAHRGDVSKRLKEYSLDTNRSLVRASFAETEFLRETPPEAVEALARYPEATTCRP
ncbi:MAG TPA: linear amide C-N hydrolase [Candidatus Krumholzibacteria bacterium]|nr:linear amide C-N hydrolase [Candidatus Krumholzibacteria bacterium]